MKQSYCTTLLDSLIVQLYFLGFPVNKIGVTQSIAHGLRTPREETVFTARPKIQSQSQIYRYSRSIFCPPRRPNFSDIFDLCLHWVSIVHDWGSARGLLGIYGFCSCNCKKRCVVAAQLSSQQLIFRNQSIKLLMK